MLVDRLFFAIRPDAAAKAAAISIASQINRGRSLHQSRFVSDERLHVTLHWLKDYAGLPPHLVAAAMAAGDSVNAEPFDVMFDQVESLNGNGPLALKGSKGMAALRRFQREVGTAMAEAGIGGLARTAFKPHVTLMYDNDASIKQAIDPIHWTVDEFLLIHSIVGESKHIVLRSWHLTQKQHTLF